MSRRAARAHGARGVVGDERVFSELANNWDERFSWEKNSQISGNLQIFTEYAVFQYTFSFLQTFVTFLTPFKYLYICKIFARHFMICEQITCKYIKCIKYCLHYYICNLQINLLLANKAHFLLSYDTRERRIGGPPPDEGTFAGKWCSSMHGVCLCDKKSYIR